MSVVQEIQLEHTIEQGIAGYGWGSQGILSPCGQRV